MNFIRSTIALACAAWACAATTPALAGSWQSEKSPPPEASPFPYGPMRAVRYVSQTMGPGEEVILAATPLFPGSPGNIYGGSGRMYSMDPEEHVFVILVAALTSGSVPITGFDGVATAAFAAGNRRREEIGLYRPKDATGRPNPDGKCADVVRFWEFGGPSCSHACFVTREDLEARRNAVSCDSGKAYWIAIEIVRALGGNARFPNPAPPSDPNSQRLQGLYKMRLRAYEAQGREMDAAIARGEASWLFQSQVENSTMLRVKVRHGRWESMDLDIDDNFRRTLYRKP